MQTYLPFPDFYQSAKSLDKKRLNNQRNECFMLMDILLDEENQKKAWRNHPVTRMWKGHEEALYHYLRAIHQACIIRKIAHSPETEDRLINLLLSLPNYNPDKVKMPDWIGENKPIHKNHKQKLLSKDKKHYCKYFKEVPDGRSWYPVKWGRKQKTGYGDQDTDAALSNGGVSKDLR